MTGELRVTLHRHPVVEQADFREVPAAEQLTVDSAQLSMNPPRTSRTAGPSSRTWVSRQIGVLSVAGPHVGDTDAAGKADLSVDDEQPAVHPVVELVDRVPVRGAEEAGVHPGPAEPFQMGPIELRRELAAARRRWIIRPETAVWRYLATP